MDTNQPKFLIIGNKENVEKVLNRLPNKNKLYDNYLYDIKEPFVEYGFFLQKEDINIEEILTNELALNNTNLSNLIITCIKNFPLEFRTHKIEWWDGNTCLGSESYYTDIYEDERLPYYYILHIDLFQSYKLLHKETGKLLNFTFHDLCPSDDNSILNGRYMSGDLSNYDFCSTLVDWSNDDIEGTVKVLANKNKEIFQTPVLAE